MPKNPRLIDMTGCRYGAWTVLNQAGNTKGGGALWNARCDCGAVKAVLGADLRQGKSTNCGCEKARRTGDRARTHGAAGTRLYRIWQNMRARCGRKSHPQFPEYGGRGIAVCADWKDFPTFQRWALSNGYADNLSIDRIDNDQGYRPDNCRWADAETQSNNRRFVRKMPDGRSAPLAAKANGIPARTFSVRVTAGWSIEQAATHPYNTDRVERARNEKGQFA